MVKLNANIYQVKFTQQTRINVLDHTTCDLWHIQIHLLKLLFFKRPGTLGTSNNPPFIGWGRKNTRVDQKNGTILPFGSCRRILSVDVYPARSDRSSFKWAISRSKTSVGSFKDRIQRHGTCQLSWVPQINIILMQFFLGLERGYGSMTMTMTFGWEINSNFHVPKKVATRRVDVLFTKCVVTRSLGKLDCNNLSVKNGQVALRKTMSSV